MKKLRIGTRGSKLALWQANWVEREIWRNNLDNKIALLRRKTVKKNMDRPEQNMIYLVTL